MTILKKFDKFYWIFLSLALTLGFLFPQLGQFNGYIIFLISKSRYIRYYFSCKKSVNDLLHLHC